MDRGRVERIARGELPAAEMTAGERAAEALVRKTVQAPARLGPEDLRPLHEAYGLAGAMEVAVTACSFHLINRIADLVGIRSDLPIVRRTAGRAWSWAVRVQTFLMGLVIDMGNRTCEALDIDEVTAGLERARGYPLPPGYRQLQASPALVNWLATGTESLPRLDAAMLARVTHGVEAALPAALEEAQGFHRRPPDPFDALVFVGTRYPARTTDAMVAAVRVAHGYGDPQLTDLFFAISMANCFSRLDRLLAAPLSAGLIHINAPETAAAYNR
jgi:hypothetical protein